MTEETTNTDQSRVAADCPNERLVRRGSGTTGKDSAEETVRNIDEKMGEGWARRFANVLAADMTLKVEVTFVFEKFDSAGNFKYQSRRSA